MRLIDADRLCADIHSDKGPAISLSQIQEAETVEALPKEELERFVSDNLEANERALNNYHWEGTEEYLKGIIYAFECMKRLLS